MTLKKIKQQLTPLRLGLLITVLAALLASLPLFKPGFFFMHDDVQVMRLYQMERCLQDGQIPCRWVPDMGAGYGHPLYNYHPVFAYYLGLFFRVFGLSFITITKLLFFLTYLLSGLFVYLLVTTILSPLPATVAAIFFIFAPYHAVDVYVRGAMTESWGIVFFPLIFYSLYQLSRYPQKAWLLVLTSLSFTGLFLAHNIMTMLFTPIALIWGLYWFAIHRQLKQLPRFVLAFLLGLGLSAFFLIPAFAERSLVKIDTLTSDYYNFRHHFATVRQLFLDRSWGYGPSRPGPQDGLSFQLGWPHWWIVSLGILATAYLFLKKKTKLFFLALFASLLYLGSLFMTHSKSIYIWDSLSLISFVQFPWRFLGIAMFAGSLLAAAALLALPKRLQLPLAALACLLIIVLNFGYFKESGYDPGVTDASKLSGTEYQTQSLATLLDYMPTQVQDIPTTLAPDNPWLVEGKAEITEFAKRSNFWRFTVKNNSTNKATIRVPVFDFPNWLVLLNQQPIEHKSDNSQGVIELEVPPGQYTVVGRLENTSLRTLSNIITGASFALLLLYFIIASKKG